MKKICLILFAIVTGFAASSCSDETSEPLYKPYGEMTFIVDDVQKVYNNVYVTEYVNSAGEKFLDVTGSINGDPTEYINFQIRKYYTGLNRATRWEYSDDSNLARRRQINGEEYDIDSNTLLNSDDRLRGTFSGRLYNMYSDIPVIIEAGEFSYNFNLPQE